MSVIAWLRQTFAAVPDVKFAASGSEPSLIFQHHQADLVIQTWMGARIYCYILNDAPKVRDLRNILKENTRNGVGTLFIVHHDLLPTDGAYISERDTWQEALALLNGDFIYTYICADDAIYLRQVHYNRAPIKDEYIVWHLCDFVVENVAVRSRDIHDTLRGNWRVADIASPAFKRRINNERVNRRYHYRTARRKKVHSSNVKSTPDELMAAYQMLQVGRNAPAAEIKASYRRLAMMLHPDVSALPRSESERRFKALNQAYERIKTYHDW